MTSSDRIMQLIEWGCLLLGLMAITVTEQYAWYVTFGLLFMGAAFLLRVWRRNHFVKRTRLEIPVLFLILSAGVAAYISYDQSAAWLQFGRIIAGVILFYAVVDADEYFHNKIAMGFIFAVTVLAIYWPLQHDFGPGQSKFVFIDQIGQWIRRTLPEIPGPSIHSNVAAGTLVLGIPFGIFFVWQSWQKQRWLAMSIYGICTLVIGGCLLLTSSRGAWLGSVGVITLAVLVWLQRRKFSSQQAKTVFWLVVIGAILFSIAILFISGYLGEMFGLLPDPTGTLENRTNLWGQGINLIQDYLFTGSGLMSFRMIYAVYGILIHVPHHDHLHNTYLEVWLEQGILGVLALLWGLGVVIGWTWKNLSRKEINIWGWAGLAAIGAAAIHGLFDVVFYVTRTLPLIGLIAGFAYLVNGKESTPGQEHLQKINKLWLGVVLLLVLASGIVFHRPILATLYANLGAVRQGRSELTAYDAQHFDNPTLDMVRRIADLSAAEAAYEQSLAWEKFEETSLRRLVMIKLSQGEYEQALILAQRAWDSGKHDEITRLVYGDALTASGKPEQAAEILQGIGWAEDRLAFQAWYRYWLGVPPGNADYQRCVSAWKAALALNPQNSLAADELAKAEAMLEPQK